MSVATSTSAPLVTTDWTREHLDDPKVRFLEVDVDTDSYDTGHLPGATGVNWKSQLTDLVRRELTPHGIDDPNRISVAGERVTLPPAIAVAIGMAVHELATNAARHGALSSTSGKVEVSWSVSCSVDARHLQIIWKESGGPMVREPKRRGFGSRLIEQGLKHDLHGEAKLFFESSGLKCVIEAVLPAERAAA